MPLIRPLRGFTPEIGEDVFIAENAVIIGQFKCGTGCSFWYGSVIRADVNAITLGNAVNLQDNATIHCTYEKYPTVIGNNVSIGHNAVVHGCTVEDNVLIGMGAIVLDGAVVRSGSIVGAGALVPPNEDLQGGYLYIGSPVRQVRELTGKEKQFLTYSAEHYVRLKDRHQKTS